MLLRVTEQIMYSLDACVYGVFCPVLTGENLLYYHDISLDFL